jgi:glycerol-3-phosphate dehydrogenase (NAD(P)+)
MTAGPRAVLVTRAVAEASRLGVAAGAEARTFAGLAGLGNLLVRASGDRSADYVLGRRLAAGVLSADAGRTEGARAALAGCELAKALRVRMPVLQGVAAVLSGEAEPKDAAAMIGDTVAVEE